MDAPTTRPFAPDFDFTTAEIYREVDDKYGVGWQLCRDWNTHPAREIEVERLYLGWLNLARLTSKLAHHIAMGHLVIAEGIDGLDELAVIQFLEAVGKVVLPDDEVPDDEE